MRQRIFWYGLAIWMAATILLRLAGHHVLRPMNWVSVIGLFVSSFLVTAWLVRRLCRWLQLPPHEWLLGAMTLLLPTLLLDPFSSAFFPAVFPNMAPEVAGVFGGWMLVFCAGGLVGAAFRNPS
jgi:hypothetical protein